MNRTLCLKELAQHWPAMLWLTGATLVGIPVLVAVAVQQESGSALQGLLWFLRYFVPLLVAVLGHRLVVMEYQARTQLFLEGLPLSRLRMVMVKYGVGLCVIWALVLLAATLVMLMQAGAEPVDPSLLVKVFVRTLAWSWMVWNLFFLMGFLGRYRVPLFVLLVLAIDKLDDLKEIRLGEWGPFALVNSQFSYERDAFQQLALLHTLLLGILCLGLAMQLARMREGSVAALLAEAMSRREKLFFSALVAGFVVLSTALPDRREHLPLDLGEQALVVRVGAAVVQVSNAGNERAAADQLAQRAARELAGAFEYLGMADVPSVFITRGLDLDPGTFELAEPGNREGVQVRAHFGHRDWREEDFLAWLLREALLAETRSRAGLEHKLWVLDGFPDFWLAGQGGQGPFPAGRERVLTLRALYGARDGLTHKDLETWLRFRERAGPEIAAGVGWSGLAVLQHRWGSARSQAFLRRVLAQEVPKDFRAAVHERRFPPAKLVETEVGVTLEEWLTEWQRVLATARERYQPELARLPVVRGEVRFVPLSSATRRVHYQASARPAVRLPDQFRFQHCELPVFDRPIASQNVRQSERFGSSAERRLPEEVARGARFGWNISLEVPALQCRVNSGWQREEVR